MVSPVLVVEDNPMLKQVFVTMLERLGYETDTASDGISCGMDDHVQKPLTIEMLQVILNKWVRAEKSS